MASLVEQREELVAKSNFLQRIFQEAGPEMDLSQVKCIDGDTTYKAGEIRRLNDELTEIGVEVDRLSLLEQIGKNNELKNRQMTEPSGAGFPFPSAGQSSGVPRSGHPAMQASLKKFINDH